MEKLSVPYLEKFDIYDRFSGASVPRGKVSLSLRFIYHHPQRTFLAEEVDNLQQQIIAVARSTVRRSSSSKTQSREIETIDEVSNKPSRMILSDPVFKRRWQKKNLAVVGLDFSRQLTDL